MSPDARDALRMQNLRLQQRCHDAEAHTERLLAENQRLRDALGEIASWESPLGVEYAAELFGKAQNIARAALDGTPSEDA